MLDTQNAEANIKARLSELQNVLRIVQNTFNLIADTDVKGGHCNAVAEIMGWLKGFGSTLQNQIDALQATLPKEESAPVVEAKPTELEVKA